MQKSKNVRTNVRGKTARRNTSRRNFLRIERLEDRMVLTGAAPIAANDSYDVIQDQPLEIATPGILANDTDAEGDVLSAALFAGPSHGSLALNPAGSFQYTPDAGFTGVDSFMYSAADGTGNSQLAAVTLRVGGNNAPVSQNDSFTLNEDEVLTVSAAEGLLQNDSDAEGDPLTATLVSQPLHGTLNLGPDGSFTYTPEANYSGVDGFSYLLSDGTSESGVATVTLQVNAVDDAPLAVNDEYTTNEDTPLTMDVAGGLLANDSDPDSSNLTVTVVSQPVHGTVALNEDGSFTYTPSADYNGVDGFSYTVSDGTQESDVATVTINVNPVEDAPVTANDAFSTDEDTPLAVDIAGSVLANDSDADGDSLTAALVTGPAHGTLTLNADGSFNYSPEANFKGEDTFTSTASDGTLASNEATVTLTVNSVNDAPVAAGDEFTTAEDTSLHIDASGVLANDSDPEGDALSAVLVTGPSNGTLTLNADGSFDYAPGANFNGNDSFVYQASDGSLTSTDTTVTIIVTAVNDSPVAANDAFSTDEDTPLAVDIAGSVLSNDSDAEGDSLTAALVTGPAHGTLTLNADGSFNYSPEANFNGEDTFTYSASDGTLSSTEATVTITVNSVSDAPVAANDEFTTAEDTSLHVDASGLLGNDSDADGDTLTSVLVSGPANGTLTLNADGSFDYAPGADFNGDDSFVYQASDGSLTSADTTVTIHVTAVNDTPVAVADSFTTDLNTPLTVSAPGVLVNDSDIDGDPLTAILVNGPANGTVSLAADGSLTYTPATGFSGSDSFTYKASDGSLESGETTVSITVNPATDVPVSSGDAYSTGEDVTLTASVGMGVLANDFDPLDSPLTAELVAGPTNGTLTLNGDGSFSYAPNANYYGTDSFTYVANNGVTTGAVMTATIVVQPLNDAPVAASDDYTVDTSGGLNVVSNSSPVSPDDAFTVDACSSLTVDAPGVLGNDTDADSDVLTAALVSGPAHGALTLNDDGSLSYTPDAGFVGTDSFTYMANDGKATGNVATVAITVQDLNQNHNPEAKDDGYVATAETLLSVPADQGVLANDTDADGNPLTAVLVNGTAHGTLTLNADGSFDYQPEVGFTGADTFTYQASDGVELSAVATVTIDVGSAANNRPVAVNDHFTTTVDQPLSVSAAGLLGNDSDPDGNPITAELFSGPQHGTIAMNPDGSFVYTPDAGFQGRDSFIYRSFDGELHSALAAVTIYVNPAPSMPGVVQGGNESPRDCLLGGAITSVLSHLELARHGMDEDLLDSLAMDLQGLKGHSGSLHGNDSWML
ncbi:MAG: tandem-95 repeat protein [Planctomycetales bacterium]|nr:tandem-95 repeat protein [Planctomycetales bacterium]